MKTFNKILLALLAIFLIVSCQDLEDLNKNPNQPDKVSTSTLLTGAQKKMMDYIYDTWFSGRQAGIKSVSLLITVTSIIYTLLPATTPLLKK